MRGVDIATHPRWIRDVAIRGRPLTFGNLERAVPGASNPRAFQAWVAAQFDPSVTWDDVAWVREHWAGRLVVKGILDPRRCAPRCRRGCRRHRRLKPWRTAARLRAIDRTRARGRRRRGRRTGRGAGRRRSPDWSRCRQDGRARCARGDDRARLGVGGGSRRAGGGAPRASQCSSPTSTSRSRSPGRRRSTGWIAQPSTWTCRRSGSFATRQRLRFGVMSWLTRRSRVVDRPKLRQMRGRSSHLTPHLMSERRHIDYRAVVRPEPMDFGV